VRIGLWYQSLFGRGGIDLFRLFERLGIGIGVPLQISVWVGVIGKVEIPWSGSCGVWAVDGAAMLIAAVYIVYR